MALKEFWIGTQGPFAYDDDYVLDEDGTSGSQFSGSKPKVINSDGPARIGPAEDPEDAAQSGEVSGALNGLISYEDEIVFYEGYALWI